MSTGYVTGQEIRLTIAFTNQANAPVDPTTVVFKVKDGRGAETTYDHPAKDSTGVYHQDVLIACTGVWYYRAEGTGAAIGADERSFLVRPTHF